MDMLLIVLTVISLGVAIVMSAVAWRLYHQERQRQAARVAALAETLDDVDAPEPWPVIDEARLTPASAPAFDVAHPDAVMFDTDAATGAPSRIRPIAAMGVAAALLTVGALTTLGSGTPQQPEPTKERAGVPLELLSLAHNRRNGEIDVAGVVRNPASAGALQDLVAVVFFYDRSGAFVSSARARVDKPRLVPGDSSPFIVSLGAHSGTVTRYRVSFRRDESGIVPHVDRREVD